MSLLKKAQTIKSMSEAVRMVIDKYPVGHEFHGNELKRDVVRIYPLARHMYVDTILRRARHSRRSSFIAKNSNKSLYQKVCAKTRSKK